MDRPEHLDALRRPGADRVQGYHIDRPMLAEEFTALLASDPVWRHGEVRR